MKLNNKILLESEVSELLVNKDFLKYFKKFLEKGIISFDALSEEAAIIIDNLLSNDLYSKDFNYSKEELLKTYGNVFSIPFVLNSFMEFLAKFKIPTNELNLYAEVGDYLISLFNEGYRYENDIKNIEEDLKTVVSNIIPREVNDIRIKLLQKRFSQFTQDDVPIVGADFNDCIDVFKGKNPDNHVYLKVKDYLGKDSYINRQGVYLKDYNSKRIINIEYHFYFGDVLIAKLVNEDFETVLDITNISTTDYSFNNFTDAREGTLVDDEYYEDGIEEFKNKGIFKYLYLARDKDGETESGVFNSEIERVNMLDILKFINHNHDLLDLTLSKLEKIQLSKIGKLHNISGIKFLEVEIDNEGSSYDNCVLMGNGQILLHENNYEDGMVFIDTIQDTFNYLGKDFLGYSINSFGIEGHIDANGKCVKINGEHLVSLNKFHLSLHGTEDYYILNGNKDKLLKEVDVILQLSEYEGFEENEENEELEEVDLDIETLDENGKIFGLFGIGTIEGEEVEKIICKIDNNGDLQIYLKVLGKLKIVEYKDLINKLKNKKEYKEILKEMNINIKRISNL